MPSEPFTHLILYLLALPFVFFFFFFQAEDGIRDVAVTGVQTCALPISPQARRRGLPHGEGAALPGRRAGHPAAPLRGGAGRRQDLGQDRHDPGAAAARRRDSRRRGRSEERRVGKEGRSRWAPDALKKKRE